MGVSDLAPIRALTLHPEWAWAVAHLGKDVENRKWHPHKWVLAELKARRSVYLAIHAGLSFGGMSTVLRREHLTPVITMAERAGWSAESAGGWVKFTHPSEDDVLLPWARRGVSTSAIVAVGRLEGASQDSASPWYAGGDQYGWELADVVTLPSPVRSRGRQGLWNLEPDVLAAVRVQYRLGRPAVAA